MNVIYLDNCATTRVDDEVLEAMLPYLREEFGNPSSPHALGKRARRAVERAAQSVAALVGDAAEDVVFTSGATESNNIALLGSFAHADRAPANALLCPTDHKSTLMAGQELARRGIDVRTMPVGTDGVVDLDAVAGLLDRHSRIAAVAAVNSELGTVQPVAALAARCRPAGCLLHVDAAQAAGRIPLDTTCFDTLALSGHKIHGPKGIGALVVRAGLRGRLHPVVFGGGQHELRSGTIPAHLVVGLGVACDRAAARLADDLVRVTRLRAVALDRLGRFPGMRLNNDPRASVPHVLNVVLPGVRGESLVAGLSSVAVATGSACNSDSQQPSYVLTAIGVSARDANSSVRLCLDPAMSEAELARGVDLLCDRALALADVLSPATAAG